MNRGLIELLLRSARGRVVRSARLLRRPRYAIGFVVGFSYFGWLFLNPWSGSAKYGIRVAELQEVARIVEVLVASGIGLGVAIWWLTPGGTPIRMNAAEIHQLLPAPISRRALIQYEILRSTITLLFGVTIVTFFSRPASPLEWIVRLLAFWIAFFLWDLHGKVRNLWKARLGTLRPAEALRQRVLVYGGVVAVLGLWAWAWSRTLGPVRRTLAALDGDIELDDPAFWNRLQESVDTETLSTVLWPIVAVLRPVFEAGHGAPPWIWLAPLALVAVHYFTVIAFQVRFEEAVLAREQRETRKRTREGRPSFSRGERRTRVPFALPVTGSPATAILWKNLLAAGRIHWKEAVLWGLVPGAVVAVVVAATGASRAVVIAAIVVGGALCTLFPLLTAAFWSKGLQEDLKRAELLRTWPLSGPAMVRGLVATPVVLALAPAYVGVGVFLGAELGSRLVGADGLLPATWGPAVGVPAPVLWVCALAGFLPAIVAIVVLGATLRALTALLMPGWFLTFEAGHNSIAAPGQRIVAGLIQAVAFAFAFLPELILAAAVAGLHAALDLPVHALEFPVWGLLFAIPVAVEVWLLALWAGRLWDRLDPSSDLLGV